MDLQEVKAVHQSVICPWTSSAPLQSVTSTKLIETTEEAHTDCSERIIDNETRSSTSEENKTEEKQEKAESINVKQSSSQFFHFLRLMQLFPNVHPATLHTVMILCKNDFFVAVDKLLYAKRCKELYQNRKHLFQNYSGNKGQRYSPYLCNGAYCQNVNCVKPQVIKLDSKRMTSRNRYAKNSSEKAGVGSNTIDLSPVTLQCNVPIQPLSPVSPEDLSSQAFCSRSNIEAILQK